MTIKPLILPLEKAVKGLSLPEINELAVGLVKANRGKSILEPAPLYAQSQLN